MPDDEDRPSERPRPTGAREGVVADEPVRSHQEWGAASSLPRERGGPPPGLRDGEPDLLEERGATLGAERVEPPYEEGREERGTYADAPRGPPPAPRRRRRPVDVTPENRPPGDPGPDVDVQEWVGGQPGREDPGATGGPSHREVGARDQHGADRIEPPGVARYRDRQEELRRIRRRRRK